MRQNKIHRIFIDADINIGSKITPDKNTAARIKRILRIKRNEKIIIFNGDGQDYICIFDDSDREKILVERSEKNSKINFFCLIKWARAGPGPGPARTGPES